MKITRRFTKPGQDVFATVEWERRTSRISDADGKVVFEMADAEVPRSWSQLATDIMVSKYFRKAGVPLTGADGTPRRNPDGSIATGPESSARQVIHRLAGCWRHWGQAHGYFDSAEDASAFYDELAYMLLHQMGAPNSPQWFNTGLHWAYAIDGPAQGHWVADPRTGEVRPAPDAYSHPQPHACFIQSIKDDLVGSGGIMDLWVREARLFKYGSGTGTNFSPLRAENEPLSGGGRSSGLMSFLRIGDRAAGAIKSGGTTRRAAKMVCLDADHPDIEAFINWKVREELKVAAMVEGLKHLPREERALAEKLGLRLDYDFNGEAYYTVSGQNSNNSVRLPDSFFDALDAGGDWNLVRRTDGRVSRTIKARDLWDQICLAAWRCADPGLQFDTTINDWNTCPASGRINASNPCVTGDTLVATSTGYRRIRDLVGRQAEIIGGDGRPVPAERIFRTGRRPVYQLRTRSGYRLRLTADHPVRTANRGDVPAAELTRDDVLLLGRPGFGDQFVPEAFGGLLGAAVGDGCITGDGSGDVVFISLGRAEAAVAHRLQSDIVECKYWLATGDRRALRPTGAVRTRTGLRVGTGVGAIVGKLREFAVLDAGAAHKAFTDRVFALDRPSQAAILRGVFTTDGTVANYGSASQWVALDSTSLELLRQVQLLLLGFGIKSKIYENRRALGRLRTLLPDSNGGRNECSVRQIHSLRISRRSRVLFEREIGFFPESHKAATLAELNRTVGTYGEDPVDRVDSLAPSGTEDVYDLTEPLTHHFVADGIVVHNCSEYHFLDNTACNLASINLLRFYDPAARVFDVESFEHAIRLWTMVLEIAVLMAAYPSREIAEQSWRFRTLGLGYANLGALLMQAGIPYDSDEGRAVCGAITAILTGRACATSAEMARELLPFPGFAQNRDSMLRVVRNHRRAAWGVPRDSEAYEGLRIKPVPIDHDLFRAGGLNIANSAQLLERATRAWDEALELGEAHGYRNAQVTVIAPTGTIGLLMDCDTTGVEPDFALTKFKKLAGGGYFKIANQSLRPALRALGYSTDRIDDIVSWVMGTLSLDTPMADAGARPRRSFRDFLAEHGYTSQDVVDLENQLPTVFELPFAFSAWAMPEHVLRAHGVDPATAREDPAFNGLRVLGLDEARIEALNRVICGTQTVEGAPHLSTEHLAVFDCANRCGKLGRRFIRTEGHIRMMAAAQPFISGAISKTINLPAEAEVADIASAYRLSWELGLKANALYRDGSKLSQPLATRADREPKAAEAPDPAVAVEAALGKTSTEAAAAASATSISSTSFASAAPAPARTPETVVVERVVERIVDRPLRRRLPDTRASITHRFNVAGHEGYLTVGLYDDGAPGELFITMAKEGSTIGGLMDCLGTAISVALQYGVPVESLVNKFAHQRFEPMGMTTNRDIPFAKSLVDYIFRWLGMEFVPGFREANLPKRPSTSGAPGQPEGRDPPAPRPASWPEVVLERVGGNGGRPNGEPAAARRADAADPRPDDPRGVAVASPLDQSHATMMGDAPACDVCGSITVRNGNCYKCLNCGNSMGCS